MDEPQSNPSCQMGGGSAAYRGRINSRGWDGAVPVNGLGRSDGEMSGLRRGSERGRLWLKARCSSAMPVAHFPIILAGT
jgi:hypothetical protein